MQHYPTSSDFAVNVSENWKSECLQFFLYVFATVWLLQRGSPESWVRTQPGSRLNGVRAWLAQSVSGMSAYNAEQLADFGDPVSWFGYLASSDFWNRTLQNWQSEFIAIGSMAVFSVYLRQRGSPESKPVGAPHHATDESG